MDSSDVDAALSAKLVHDPVLASLMPDGIFFDVAAHGATRFVLVSLVSHSDDYMLGGEAYELFTFLIKAVALSTTGADVKAAAARIHTLLQDGALTAPGYSLMRSQRVERIRYTEVDDDRDTRWQHRGGRYEVWVTEAASTWMQPGWAQIGWTQ